MTRKKPTIADLRAQKGRRQVTMLRVKMRVIAAAAWHPAPLHPRIIVPGSFGARTDFGSVDGQIDLSQLNHTVAIAGVA